MNTLVAYFSRPGENYFIGGYRTVDKGNAKIIAERINKTTPSDIFEIEPINKYSDNYKKCCQEAKFEFENNIFPEIKNYIESVKQYKNIILVYPCWYETIPQIVATFLKHFDFANKNIYPVCTHEGSGLGKSEKDISKFCRRSKVHPGFAIRGTYAEKCASSIEKWIATLNL